MVWVKVEAKAEADFVVESRSAASLRRVSKMRIQTSRGKGPVGVSWDRGCLEWRDAMLDSKPTPAVTSSALADQRAQT